MQNISLYISQQPQELQGLLFQLDKIITDCSPKIEAMIKFGTPFYSYYGFLCYLSVPKKKKRVELGFIRGYELADEQGVLNGEGLTTVKKLIYHSTADFNEDILLAVLQEALLLNEWRYENKKRKKN
jgi:hypothetical protein